MLSRNRHLNLCCKINRNSLQSDRAVETSFVIKHRITKKKPFSDGELIKESFVYCC